MSSSLKNNINTFTENNDYLYKFMTKNKRTSFYMSPPLSPLKKIFKKTIS